MHQLGEQLKEYNQFFREFCEAYFNGMHEQHKDVFAHWAMARITRLVNKYDIFGDGSGKMDA